MEDPANRDALVRSVNRLTVAVWVLVGLTAARFLLGLCSPFFPATVADFTADGIPSSFSTRITSKEDAFAGFPDAPLEKQIELASVVALARFQTEGKKQKCTITEILKQAPGTVFHYKVGDHYAHGDHYPRGNEMLSDGLIIFFVGSPAEMRLSMTYHGDRIGGLADMPIEEVRRLASKPAN